MNCPFSDCGDNQRIILTGLILNLDRIFFMIIGHISQHFILSSLLINNFIACDRCDVRISKCTIHSKYNYTCDCREGFSKNAAGECIGQFV